MVWALPPLCEWRLPGPWHDSHPILAALGPGANRRACVAVAKNFVTGSWQVAHSCEPTNVAPAICGGDTNGLLRVLQEIATSRTRLKASPATNHFWGVLPTTRRHRVIGTDRRFAFIRSVPTELRYRIRWATFHPWGGWLRCVNHRTLLNSATTPNRVAHCQGTRPTPSIGCSPQSTGGAISVRGAVRSPPPLQAKGTGGP